MRVTEFFSVLSFAKPGFDYSETVYLASMSCDLSSSNTDETELTWDYVQLSYIKSALGII